MVNVLGSYNFILLKKNPTQYDILYVFIIIALLFKYGVCTDSVNYF